MSDAGCAQDAGVVDAKHPMLPGHFPGRPIVPGAWLLAWVVEAATQRLKDRGDDRAVTGVKRVKFVRSLMPEQMFALELKPGSGASDSTWRFTLSSDGAVIVDGSLQLQRN